VATLSVLAAAGALALAIGRGPVVRSAPLPDGGILPEFALTDHLGQPLTRESLRGSVWVASFIFTRCAGQCPVMMAQMAAVARAFAGEPQLRLVAITVDPAHDTPEILAAYAGRLGIADGRWRLATGSPEAIAALAREGFTLGISNGGPPEEPITHSVRFVLVDQAGRIRGSYDATDTPAMRRLHQDAQRLLR